MFAVQIGDLSEPETIDLALWYLPGKKLPVAVLRAGRRLAFQLPLQ